MSAWQGEATQTSFWPKVVLLRSARLVSAAADVPGVLVRAVSARFWSELDVAGSVLQCSRRDLTLLGVLWSAVDLVGSAPSWSELGLGPVLGLAGLVLS